MTKKANQVLWPNVLKRLLKDVTLLSCYQETGGQFVEPFLKLIEKLEKNHGRKQALKIVKSYNAWIHAYVLEQRPDPLLFTKVDRSGFPKVLRPWKGLANGSTEDVRFLLSIFRTPEVLTLEPEIDIKNIEQEPPKESWELLKEFKKWLPHWSGLKSLPSKPLPCGLILSNNAGPNGPATVTAMADLKALRDDENLCNNVKRLLSLTKISEGELDIEQYSANTTAKVKHSKLVGLSDKYGKTRIVAIGDWFSNVSLSGLHSTFMAGLSKLRSDCTYRQSSIPNLIKGLGMELYSSDMTDATTCFHIAWEQAVVEAKYGTDFAETWKSVIADRDFILKDGTKTRYKSGNPMGMLSSWAIFAFTHHAFIEWCAFRCGLHKYKDYILLGDDNLNSNEEVYNEYCRLLPFLGVSISRSKCTSSKHGFAEFAKRYFTPKGEITGLPVTLLKDLRTNPEQFLELVRIMRERGYSEENVTAGVQAFLVSMKKRRKQVTRVLSAPREIIGMLPVKGLQTENTTVKTVALSVAPLLDCLAKARQDKFWGEVDKIAEYALKGTYPVPIRGQRIHVPEDHPMLAVIGDKLMSNYLASEDEYSVYERWMNGESYELALVPSLDQYRYKNRGHKKTRAKYYIANRALAYASGEIDFLYTPERPKISNFELFQLGFSSDFGQEESYEK
ncbi:TPA_asm: RNA-dependent polymerase [Proteus mito-like virus]|nr:TPA_asm: RNA-dependent polymerase [Proteus mito-like virus]|mmetsp:Transcript_7306/g.9880  ORF Transcript_7306/g.9880 Transcript_7306/m.9880 type:complete len:674 (-) Transcript_7306:82-2103(-)|eukprot:CAMPEP_0196582038 /NCGR_PEP_ID=MMETSP1081-20130531/37155_1 /TAXON_ID=36882 /ORGANISM="Pyramimonas amylifera, Strain CCMP720" /LENGTH=673 /DNA_ID=CAMNT_0041902501 /DNA_START=113 /DNA_END=2134 /DNA_ORIENTATION=-